MSLERILTAAFALGLAALIVTTIYDHLAAPAMAAIHQTEESTHG